MEFKISFLRIKLRLFANFWGVLLSFEVPALCELIANNANYDDDDNLHSCTVYIHTDVNCSTPTKDIVYRVIRVCVSSYESRFCLGVIRIRSFDVPA